MADSSPPLCLESTIKLNDGTVMPLFGLGTSRIGSPSQVENVVARAIDRGYRLIDTALYYGTEEGVSKGIKKSGLKREDLFLVTKIWETGSQQSTRQLQQSLQNLGTEYIDLYLIHHPLRGQILDTYDAMLEMKRQGFVRSVGVSNFGVHHLEGLKSAGRPLPSVNQIELHVFQHNTEIVDYCQRNNITVMGYSPLAKMDKPKEPYLLELASKHHKSLAQIMLRWSVQNDYITIPKTSNLQRVEENADVFDFSLSEDEMANLKRLDTGHRCTYYYMNPTEAAWDG